MPLTVDEYRMNWARRYIREAEADLSVAEKNPTPAVSISFALLAMRKSQTAIYYSLGDPTHLAPLISQNMADEKKAKDVLMRILIQIEQLIQRDSRRAETLDKKALIEEARGLLGIASQIVDLVIEEAEERSA